MSTPSNFERLQGAILHRFPNDERAFAYIAGPLITQDAWDNAVAWNDVRVDDWYAERSWCGAGFVYAITYMTTTAEREARFNAMLERFIKRLP